MFRKTTKDRDYTYEHDFTDDSHDSPVLRIIREKRHLLDNCFEDENFSIEPC